MKEFQLQNMKQGNTQPVSISSEISDVAVAIDTPLLQCIGKLKHHKVLFAIDPVGLLVGSITNGDLRRFLEGNPKHALDTVTAGDVSNTSVMSCSIKDKKETFARFLSDSIQYLPLVDEHKRLVAFAFHSLGEVRIGERTYSKFNNDIYIIAEIGVNHNGDVSVAKELITAASETGFNAVKFQVRSEDLFSTSSIEGFDLSTQYLHTQINETNLDFSTLRSLFDFSRGLGLDVIATPFDKRSLEFIVEYRVDAIKIASCDLTNEPLLKSAAEVGLPLIISTGMAWEREIIQAFEVVSALTDNYAFLHTNSTYPAPMTDLNLSYIQRLNDMLPSVIGYSSHDATDYISIAAIGLGARIVEVHITLSKDMPGTDHKASLEKNQLKQFVSQVRAVSHALGIDSPRTVSQGEKLNRIALGKSLCYARNLSVGHSLVAADFELRSPGSGIPFEDLGKLLGKNILIDVAQGSLVSEDDFGSQQAALLNDEVRVAIRHLKSQNFSAGIPVRYHDYQKLTDSIDYDFVEFHMSEIDLKLDPGEFIIGKSSNEHLYVHCIEQYNDGFILDFASQEADVVSESFSRVEELFGHAAQLKEYFPNAETVQLILNLGGFSKVRITDAAELQQKHDIAIGNLRVLAERARGSSIELLLQTMPAMPWHLGGTSNHNLMTTAESVVRLAEETGLGVCYDLSHSALAATYFDFDVLDFTQKIKQYVKYLHIADASSLAEEGMQVMDGELDLLGILKQFDGDQAFNFIPEIWNGHAQNGLGFKVALTRLSQLLGSK